MFVNLQVLASQNPIFKAGVSGHLSGGWVTGEGLAVSREAKEVPGGKERTSHHFGPEANLFLFCYSGVFVAYSRLFSAIELQCSTTKEHDHTVKLLSARLTLLLTLSSILILTPRKESSILVYYHGYSQASEDGIPL